MEGTYHRKQLLPPAVAFGSREGCGLFRESLEQGYLENYFLLAEHYQTQSHPAFCGIASLAMALNSLAIDPKRVWQGIWRWYDESMLDCCESHEVMKLKGITLAKLACIARCNRAAVALKYASAVTVDQFREDVKNVCSNKITSNCQCGECCVCKCCTGETAGCDISHVLIVSYNRAAVNQTGSGHFSPIGGYNSASDMVLIMDVAR